MKSDSLDGHCEFTTLLWFGESPPPKWSGPTRWLSKRSRLPDLDALNAELLKMRSFGVEIRYAEDSSPSLRRYARQLRAKLGSSARQDMIEIAQHLNLPTLVHVLKNRDASVDTCLRALPALLQSGKLVDGDEASETEVLSIRLLYALEAL